MAKKLNVGFTVFAVVVVLALVFIGWGVSQTQVGGDDVPLTPEGKANACPTDTTLTITTVNALAKGTAVSPGYNVKINGGVTETFTSGTTKLTPGDVVTVIANASNFIDIIAVSEPVICGAGNRMSLEMYATDDVAAIEIFNDDGNKVDDDVAGGVINQTNLAEGESLTVEVKFKGTNEESTGDLIYIVEAGSAANITAITMSGDATKLTAIPSMHTTQTAGSKVVAFRIPAVVGAVTKSYDLTFTLGNAKTLSGGVYADVYSEQAFIDDNGQIAVGVQDASGDVKYEDTSSSDFYINTA